MLTPGVFGKTRFEDTPGIERYRSLPRLLPNDLTNWQRNDGKEASAPFTSFAGGQADRYWPEVENARDGCVRDTGSRKGDRFVCVPIGIQPGGSRRARRWNSRHTIRSTAMCWRLRKFGPESV